MVDRRNGIAEEAENVLRDYRSNPTPETLRELVALVPTLIAEIDEAQRWAHNARTHREALAARNREMRQLLNGRPTWTHAHPLLIRPPTIRVEPSFKGELGCVFIGIGDWDRDTGAWTSVADGGIHRAIWLDRGALADLRRALDAAEAWSEAHGEDCPDDCSCQI